MRTCLLGLAIAASMLGHAPSALAAVQEITAILDRKPPARCEQPDDRRAGRSTVLPTLALPDSDIGVQRLALNQLGSRNRCSTRLASLGPDIFLPDPAREPNLGLSGAIRWVAKAGCLAPALRGVLEQVAANFGPLRVNSTCRSHRHNRRVGGARRSFHLTGSAVDFRMAGNFKEVLAFVRSHRSVGGYKHYGRGVFHIDIGPRRTW